MLLGSICMRLSSPNTASEWLQGTCKMKIIVALGAIGLNRTEPKSTWGFYL